MKSKEIRDFGVYNLVQVTIVDLGLSICSLHMFFHLVSYILGENMKLSVYMGHVLCFESNKLLSLM